LDTFLIFKVFPLELEADIALDSFQVSQFKEGDDLRNCTNPTLSITVAVASINCTLSSPLNETVGAGVYVSFTVGKGPSGWLFLDNTSAPIIAPVEPPVEPPVNPPVTPMTVLTNTKKMIAVGSTNLIVLGSGFVDGCNVTVNGKEAATVQFVDATSLIVPMSSIGGLVPTIGEPVAVIVSADGFPDASGVIGQFVTSTFLCPFVCACEQSCRKLTQISIN
jgi:hypothetical protein